MNTHIGIRSKFRVKNNILKQVLKIGVKENEQFIHHIAHTKIQNQTVDEQSELNDSDLNIVNTQNGLWSKSFSMNFWKKKKIYTVMEGEVFDEAKKKEKANVDGGSW